MGCYFTVDRNKTLKKGQEINLVRYNDVKPPELQNHIDFLFPDGVTSHGERYMLSNQTFAMGVNETIDLLFEYVRKSYFPSRPSRFQSVFGFESIEQAKRFRDRFGMSSDCPIWEVEADIVFKADMELLTLEDSLLVLSYRAHQYWNGCSIKKSPFWEYLMVPPVKVIRRID